MSEDKAFLSMALKPETIKEKVNRVYYIKLTFSL